MGTTPNYALPFPEQGDPVDVAGDIKKAMDATDAALKNVKDQVDAPIIGFEIQARKGGFGIGGWFQFGNQPAWQSPWESVWWHSRWPGGEAALKNGPAGAPGAIEIPYTGLWNFTVHFEADLGNSVWIAAIDVPPGYKYGNKWAWLWDMRINHGMITGREYFIPKGTKVSFLAYCREANGSTGGTVNHSVWMRVIGRFVGPREGQPVNGLGTPLPPIPFTPDPADPAVTNNPIP